MRAGSGELVRLDAIARFERSTGPAVVARYDLSYAAEFFATPSVGLGEAMERVEEVAADILPSGYSLAFVGEAEELRETAGAMTFVLLAAALVYMVASQFNPLIQPCSSWQPSLSLWAAVSSASGWAAIASTSTR